MITIWNEFRHEKEDDQVARLYPNGIHNVLKDVISEAGYTVKTATLDEEEHGLSVQVLDETDVLVWWGHKAHDEVDDQVAERVAERVRQGMGLVVLHSGHHSKVFKRLMGTSCDLKWREAGEKERVWTVDPTHPIASGIPEYFELEHEEMYGEHFDIPTPEQLIFVSWFQGGEVFRSGCTFTRGLGKIFYFRPGHETYPTYYETNVQRVIQNGVEWARPINTAQPVRGNFSPLEKSVRS
ncbi:ThuA domain-containing protein [Geomicrobium sp. JSM 1781026]|uniref:ThuA domain-containing protein n=1 Tax=Geomicrobium sp. JSM 1781026 TaxID=3344580 RepID=UPI0035BFF7D7